MGYDWITCPFEVIDEVFPSIPRSDYLSSLLGDFQDCLGNMESDPVYCSLNILRVFWYLKEEVISSKQEAGIWGLDTLPNNFSRTIRKAVDNYTNEKAVNTFEKKELTLLSNYISDKVQAY